MQGGKSEKEGYFEEGRGRWQEGGGGVGVRREM